MKCKHCKDEIFSARTSTFILITGAGWYAAYRLCTSLLGMHLIFTIIFLYCFEKRTRKHTSPLIYQSNFAGNRFVSVIVDGSQCNQLSTAERRLLYQTVGHFSLPHITQNMMSYYDLLRFFHWVFFPVVLIVSCCEGVRKFTWKNEQREWKIRWWVEKRMGPNELNDWWVKEELLKSIQEPIREENEEEGDERRQEREEEGKKMKNSIE